MPVSRSEQSNSAQPWWRSLMAWLLGIFDRGPSLLLGPRRGSLSVFGDRASTLPEDLLAALADVPTKKGVVVDTVRQAIEDYSHLRSIVMGPGATSDAVDDVMLLAEAESALRSIITQAPAVQVLSEVAGERIRDRAGRESAGDAMLALRDRGKALHALASAALRWGATRSDEDGERMRACALELDAHSTREAS